MLLSVLSLLQVYWALPEVNSKFRSSIASDAGSCLDVRGSFRHCWPGRFGGTSGTAAAGTASMAAVAGLLFSEKQLIAALKHATAFPVLNCATVQRQLFDRSALM